MNLTGDDRQVRSKSAGNERCHRRDEEEVYLKPPAMESALRCRPSGRAADRPRETLPAGGQRR